MGPVGLRLPRPALVPADLAGQRVAAAGSLSAVRPHGAWPLRVVSANSQVGGGAGAGPAPKLPRRAPVSLGPALQVLPGRPGPDPTRLLRSRQAPGPWAETGARATPRCLWKVPSGMPGGLIAVCPTAGSVQSCRPLPTFLTPSGAFSASVRWEPRRWAGLSPRTREPARPPQAHPTRGEGPGFREGHGAVPPRGPSRGSRLPRRPPPWAPATGTRVAAPHLGGTGDPTRSPKVLTCLPT